MKYVDWVEAVLRATVKVKSEVGSAGMVGMPQIAAALGVDEETASEALADGLKDLERIGMVKFKSQWQIEIAQEARKIQQASLRTSWPPIHEIYLEVRQETFLRAVCELAEQRADDRAWIEVIHANDVFDRLGWERDSDAIADLVLSLGHTVLLDTSRVTMGGGWNIYPTYMGVVRTTESTTTELQALVTRLLPDWETTNVDFKRELHLDSNDDKAEFIRDVLALANTQVTGERHLVIGWDPKTREFTTGIDPTVTQDRIEDLLDQYTKPTLVVRHRAFEWPGGAGEAAVIEVVRDRTKVPYRVRKRLAGAKRVIEVGDVYVRHGSHIANADADELSDLIAEAERARA